MIGFSNLVLGVFNFSKENMIFKEDEDDMQTRSIATCIILSIVTCGIYSLYWYYTLTNDVKELSGDDQTATGGMALVFAIISCGIYEIYWAYKRGQNIDETRASRGFSQGSNAVVYLLLMIFGFGIVAYALMQNEVNKLIEG